MSAFRIVFIHGYTASSQADWNPNISKKLTELGIDHAIPDLPGGEHPHAQEWLDALHKTISESDKPLALVGFSLGTRAVLLYLEKYHPKVEKVFLISAFANRLENAKRHSGNAFPDFFDHKIDLDQIKSLVGKFIVIHSKDDTERPPLLGIDYEQGVEIAKDLTAELISTDSRGHMDLPENADFILSILRKELNF